MKKSLFNIICAVFGGLILTVGCILAERYHISTPSITSVILGYTLLCILGFIPKVRQQVCHYLCDYDWAEETQNAYFRIPDLYRRSFWIIFGFVNLAFLFHTINFMWGNQDWGAVRYDTNIKDGLTDGRFAAYWLQALLTDGKILPVLNNLWAFFGLSLGAVQLCHYWKLPQNCKTYVICGLFFAVTPYTLSWLYYTKNSIGNLWIPAIVLTALMLAENHTAYGIKLYINNLLSVLLIIIALGTNFASIEFILIALFGKMLIKVLFSDLELRVTFKRMFQNLINITTAMVIYGFIVMVLKSTNLTHAEIVPHISASLFTNMIAQFTTPLPFIDSCYLYLNLGLIIISVFTAILCAPTAKTSLRALFFLPLIGISTGITEIFTSTSAPTSVACASFYVLPLIYALSLTLILKLGGYYLKRIGYILAILLIFMSFVRLAYAQKVWKFGWDAETKLSERIISRLEKEPNFDIKHQYKLLQIGDKSLRAKYYLPQTGEQTEAALLTASYYPADNSKDAWNFYYQADFLEKNADKQQAYQHREIREYLLNQARAWPHQESIRIIGDYIIIVLDEGALAQIQKELAK